MSGETKSKYEPPDQVCRNCRYLKLQPSGECRINPPVIIQGMEGGYYDKGYWPLVDQHRDFCGRFKAK